MILKDFLVFVKIRNIPVSTDFIFYNIGVFIGVFRKIIKQDILKSITENFADPGVEISTFLRIIWCNSQKS